ncbi:helix-turn-helix domain-containing protein [Caryophanon tenue]|nr:helix-turn-helix domain-containing protein [Caryophanon tenue]
MIDYEEMQHVLLFLQRADPSQLVSYYETVIGALIDYDQRQDAQLLYTLQIYFEHNGNLNKTAKQLNLSLPGLRYRIEKIESLISVDIKTGDGRFQCQLALQFYYAVQAIHF